MCCCVQKINLNFCNFENSSVSSERHVLKTKNCNKKINNDYNLRCEHRSGPQWHKAQKHMALSSVTTNVNSIAAGHAIFIVPIAPVSLTDWHFRWRQRHQTKLSLLKVRSSEMRPFFGRISFENGVKSRAKWITTGIINYMLAFYLKLYRAQHQTKNLSNKLNYLINSASNFEVFCGSLWCFYFSFHSFAR